MYRQNPFGNPDGARADLKEIEYSFITDFPFGTQITKCQDDLLNKRVIVGAKGSGKTVYLRKIQSLLKSRAEDGNTGIYVDDIINQNLNCTDSVIDFCNRFTKRVLTEKWTQLWKVSILIATAHKYLFDPKLKIYISDNEAKLVETCLKKENLYLEYQCSIYEVFSIAICTFDTAHKISAFCQNVTWLRLTNILHGILRKSPAIYIFLDSVDLEYEHAPAQWIACQKGLFYAVMDYLQKGTWGEKLHIIITLRDNVFTNILRSEHATKFERETHIFILDWTKKNIAAFLRQKIEKLDDCYFLHHTDRESPKTIENWLWIENIKNEFGDTENISEFIIRHTRNTPRDIIIICNALSALKREFSNEPMEQEELKQWIKETVLNESSFIGAELITICAKNIMGNDMAVTGKNISPTEILTDELYAETTHTKLMTVLSHLEAVVLSLDSLDKLRDSAFKIFEHDIHLTDILWNSGVIGYINSHGELIFYTQRFQEETTLPANQTWYVVRSCVATKLGLEKKK